MSHVTARQEVETLLNSLKLPIDERGMRRAAARAEWFAAQAQPLELPTSSALNSARLAVSRRAAGHCAGRAKAHL